MVKTVLGVKHQGFSDWLIQRVSAVVMTIYFIGLMGFLIMHSNLSYYNWLGLFTHSWVKIATILFLLSLLFHAWVGMWTVFTDYVKCPIGRLFLNSIVILALVGFFFAALLILWGI